MLLSDVAWNDPAWIGIYVGIIAIVVGGIVSFAIYWRQKDQNRKEITYSVISATSILSVHEEIKGKIEVLYDGKPVDNVRLIILGIWNSGNIPILPSDYLEPIRLDFGKETEILDVQILETTPSNMNVSLKWDNEIVKLEPFLLNKKEVVNFKVLLSQFNDEIHLYARIIGTEQIAESGETVFSYAKLMGSVISATASITTFAIPIPLVGNIVGDVAYKYFQKLLRERVRQKRRASKSKGPLILSIKDISDNTNKGT